MKILFFILLNTMMFGQYLNPLTIKIHNDSISIKKENFEKNILKERICKNILLDYSIVNSSSQDYALVVNKDFFLIYDDVNFIKYLNSDDNLLEKQMFQPAILIKSNNQITTTGFIDEGNYFQKLSSIKNVVNNNILIVNAYTEYRIKVKISLPINNNNLKNTTFSQQVFLSMVSHGLTKGLLSLVLKQDATVIDKNINKKTKEKLKTKNIIFYNGIINSNEVPIIVK